MDLVAFLMLYLTLPSIFLLFMHFLRGLKAILLLQNSEKTIVIEMNSHTHTKNVEQLNMSLEHGFGIYLFIRTHEEKEIERVRGTDEERKMEMLCSCWCKYLDGWWPHEY